MVYLFETSPFHTELVSGVQRLGAHRHFSAFENPVMVGSKIINHNVSEGRYHFTPFPLFFFSFCRFLRYMFVFNWERLPSYFLSLEWLKFSDFSGYPNSQYPSSYLSATSKVHFCLPFGLHYSVLLCCNILSVLYLSTLLCSCLRSPFQAFPT